MAGEQSTNTFSTEEKKYGEDGQVQTGKDSRSKQTSVGKKDQSRGWKCEDGQECVLMLTGPEATTEHATCNSGGGLNHGGHPGRDSGGPVIILTVICQSSDKHAHTYLYIWLGSQ